MASGRAITLATRGSLLALAQARQMQELLCAAHPGREVQLKIITTSGDRQQTHPLTDAGGKGLFIKEIEEALLSGEADLAIHSAKDVPAEIPPGLALAATPPRAAAHDVFITRDGTPLEALPPGAVVGTTSLRRAAQLLAVVPQARVVPFRGNIDTRLRKVAAGEVDGTFLAAAGLRRANLWPPHAQELSLDTFVPAAGQGILVFEVRHNDEAVRRALEPLHDPSTWTALEIERGIIHKLAASCMSPIGVYACMDNVPNGPWRWLVRVFIGGGNREPLRYRQDFAFEHGPDQIAATVAGALLSAGAQVNG
jgi:hydroxymethylbilane synthase